MLSFIPIPSPHWEPLVCSLYPWVSFCFFLSWLKCCLPYQETKDAAAMSHYIKAAQKVSPEGTQDGDKWAAGCPLPSPSSSQLLQPSQLCIWKTQDTGPDSWGACQRNGCSESRLLYLSIHRKVLNSFRNLVFFH